MHEASIATGILDTVVRALDGHETARLIGVHVRIGRFAGVVAECLDFAWEVVREGTLAEGAPLVIEEIEATARCRACEARFAVEEMSLRCPNCGGLDVTLVTGRELSVSELEVEE